MKKIIVFCVIGICACGGFSSNAGSKPYKGDSEIEYWGVFVTALGESLTPYVYEGLIKSVNWDDEHIRVLYKHNATRDAIVEGLLWLIDKADADDVVVFSFDGHGSYINGDYGIWPWDGINIPVVELDWYLDNISSERLVCIFDCCFAGTFVDNSCSVKKLGQFSKLDYSDVLTAYLQDDGRVILMSTMAYGLGSHWINTNPFTGESRDRCFSSMLAEAFADKVDYNSDGVCSAEEAFHYAKWKLMPLAMLTAMRVVFQLVLYVVYRHFYLPFPTMYDGFVGDLPVCLG
jgi:hypothetical protein